MALLFGLCFDELVITFLCTAVRKILCDFKNRQHALQNLVRFYKSSFTKSYVTLRIDNMLYKIWYDFVSPGLQNLVRFCKSSFTKSYVTLRIDSMLYKI